MIEAGIILPAVAIGGITVEDIPAILATGIEGIAMSGAILQAHDPDAEIKRILTM
jgi:thiamine-phosphate pyrophosphorylase